MLLVTEDKGDKPLSGAASPSPGHEAGHQEGIKCRYMRAAHGYLSNTTFHGVSWVLEDVPRATKVQGK